MGYQQIKIIEKYRGTSPEIVVSNGRLSAPIVIQPTYVYDVSDLTGYFIPCASVGYGLEWSAGYLDVSVSNDIYIVDDASALLELTQYDIKTFFYTKPEVDNLLDQIVGGTY